MSTQTSVSTASPTAFVDAWWSRVRAGDKVVQHCESCNALQLYPRRRCVKCGSAQLGLRDVSGNAKVYTFTVVLHNAPSDFQAQLPYVLGVVELEEGPRMLTRLVNCDADSVKCDMPVRWTLGEIGGKQLPCFAPAT